MKIPTVFVLAFAAGVLNVTSALQCYTCTYGGVGSAADSSCVTGNFTDDTANQTCVSATHCFTERTVHIESNVVKSVSRGCDEAGDKVHDNCTSGEEGAVETCTTTCDGAGVDVCNTDNLTTVPTPYVMCYLCQETQNVGLNQTCITTPDKETAIRCYAPRTCAVKSQWSPDESVMRSFLRTCENFSHQRKVCDAPPGRFEDCLSVCCSDYCNDGRGRTGGTAASCQSPNKNAPPARDNAAAVPMYGPVLLLALVGLII